ncbi:hypothetical protein CEE37_11475 [candidate division LCP-89 bacterium B3_LCP]|uniref:Transcriptional regulator n=1 Tax=candidate division LCP-89 bacterium B3_LCP TaxID=2012998 RepID=A0A532UVS3_UNCL8|nr:MAG: hypothetical protein CEE37_11475 [candidate division LCP-89 bacterium B3_LCP]
MQFSTGCEYAIHGLLFMATRQEDEIILVSDIAKAQNLPESYLAKVFQLLAKAGFLKSFRGARGGYALAMPPDKITLRDVTLAIEGSTPLFKPLSNKRNCDFAADCLIRETFVRAEKLMFDELEKVTIQNMVDKACNSPERLEWLNLANCKETPSINKE